MPRASFVHSARTQSPPDEVWARLQSPATWSAIGPVDEVWDAAHDPDGRLTGYRWSATVGPTRYLGTADVLESVANSHMSLRLDGGEVAGILTARLEPAGGGTIVEVELDVESRGTLSALFFPLVADAIGRGLPRQVEAFAASFDTG